MTRFILLLVTLFICFCSFGQTEKSIEISLIGRYDRHANYVSNFAGRVYNDTNKLYGFSYGLNAFFKQKISKSNSVYLGIGYYQLRVDKLKGSMPFNIPGIRTARNIDYEDGVTNLLYSTSQYHYNNLAVTIGFVKTLAVKKDVNFNIGAEAIGYKTISQKYRLMKSSNYYKTYNNKPLELGINLNAGITKEFTKFYIQPSLILPVYQNLKGDKVFYEDANMNISKWFNGIGMSLKIGKYFGVSQPNQ